VTREEALAQLQSDTPHERLKAARFLVRNAQAADHTALRDARQRETVSYVKKSLDQALANLSRQPASPSSEPVVELSIPEDVRRQIRAQAVEQVTRTLLHEIDSPIGLVRFEASREIANYAESKTKKHLDSLQRIFDAIEQLKMATTSPKPEEFDLAELIRDIVAMEIAKKPVDVSFQGPSPQIITSDPALIRMAICNGIRNAIEAVSAAQTTEPHSVIVTWGRTDVDHWVVVLDQGPGIVGPVEGAFEMGKSTKKGHSGFGLSIAKQAIETLAGSVTLQQGANGGARYEVRWER
jgi:signal transduction histidine kinase